MELNRLQKEEIIAFTQELVRCEGFSGNEAQTAKRVEQKMRHLGYDRVEADSYGNIVGLIQGKHSGPVILFDGHMDVVAAGDPAEWQYEPYSGKLVDDEIWGRGSVDMKAALAAMICVAAYVDREKFAGTMIVSGTVAEEVLPGRSLVKVLETRHVDAVLIGEPTDLKLGVAEKGRAGMELITFGEPAHSSIADKLGDNAVYRMAEVVPRIRALTKKSHPFLGNEIMELVDIRSHPCPGNGFVPDRCRTFWECRLMLGETEEGFAARWKEALAGVEKIQLGYAKTAVECYTGTCFEAIDFIPGWIANENTSFRSQVENGITNAGIPVDPFAVPYGSNANGSAGQLAIPTFVFGPGDLSLVHRPNERISIKDLLRAATAYGNILELNSAESLNQAL